MLFDLRQRQAVEVDDRGRMFDIHVNQVDAVRASWSAALAERIWPGVQKPHWNPSWSRNAAWSGWSAPPVESPSMVVMDSPSCATARLKHELMRRPLDRTVQAPHWP